MRRQSIRIPKKGYPNMIGTDFEGCGIKPSLTFFHVERGKKVKLQKVDKLSGSTADADDQDQIFQGQFFTEDCYIFLHTVRKEQSESGKVKGGSEFTWNIYVWKGGKAGLIYFGLAGTKAKDLQSKLIVNGNFNDCKIFKEKENEESDGFKRLFTTGKISVNPGKRSKVEVERSDGDAKIVKTPRLYAVHQDRLYRIPIRADCIQDDRNYILDVGSHVFSYSGPQCSRIEKAYTSEMARRRCKVDYKKIIEATNVDHGDMVKTKQFFNAIQQNEQESWSFWNDFDPPILLQLQGEQLVPISLSEDGRLFDSDCLKADKALVVDCISEVFVWYGRSSSSADQKKALELAQNVINLPGRPGFATVETVRDRMEPVYFKERFFGFDNTEHLEIGRGSIDLERMGRESRALAKERRVSQEVRRLIQFLDEEESDSRRYAKDEHIADDESGKLMAYSINEDGEITKMNDDQLGIFNSSFMYVYIFSCKNNSLHKVFTWEGQQASIRARSVAGITTSGTIIRGMTDHLEGAKTFDYVLQGKEPRLLRLIFSKLGKPFIIHRGELGGGYLRSKDEKPLGYMDKHGKTIFAFQVSSINTLPSQATEIPFETLLNNGLYSTHSYLIIRGNPTGQTASREIDDTFSSVYYYHGQNSCESNLQFVNMYASESNLDVLYSLTGIIQGNKKAINLNEREGVQILSMLELEPDVSTDTHLEEICRETRLYRVSYGAKQVGAMFLLDVGKGIHCQNDLNRDHVYLLDTGSNQIFIWFGDRASKEEIELGVKASVRFTLRGLRDLKSYDPEHIEPLLKMVDYGHENRQFKSCFHTWDDFEPCSKRWAPRLTSVFEAAIEKANMEDERRYRIEKARQDKLKRQTMELKRKSEALRKSKLKTLHRGKLVKFKGSRKSEITATDKLGDRIRIDDDKTIHVQNIGKPLQVFQDEVTVDEVNSDLRNGRNDWALYCYDNPKELAYVGHGPGGANMLLQHIEENKVYYGVIRVKADDIVSELTATDRMIFLIYVPEFVKPSLKAAVNVHRVVVSELLGPFFTEIVVRDQSEISPERLIAIASKAQS